MQRNNQSTAHFTEYSFNTSTHPFSLVPNMPTHHPVVDSLWRKKLMQSTRPCGTGRAGDMPPRLVFNIIADSSAVLAYYQLTAVRLGAASWLPHSSQSPCFSHHDETAGFPTHFFYHCVNY